MTPGHNQVHDQTHYKTSDFITALGTQITELVAHLNAGQFQLLPLLHEFDEKEECAGEGIRSCAHRLNIYCPMNMGAARERVRAAHALPGLPKISEAFSEGRVSYAKVRAMTRMASAFLSDSESKASGGDAYLVNIYTDIDTLKIVGEGATAEVEEGGAFQRKRHRTQAPKP